MTKQDLLNILVGNHPDDDIFVGQTEEENLYYDGGFKEIVRQQNKFYCLSIALRNTYVVAKNVDDLYKQYKETT